jgi:lysophospholipase L1-like esterase
MKRVFIYGDSNVWGENLAGPRVPYHQRWVNRLRRSLKNDYEIIADGACGRVAGDYRLDKSAECRGQSAFREAYKKAGPIDIIIVALGTNDLQERFNRSVDEIINDLLWYKKTAGDTKVIYILPLNFSTGEESGPEFTLKSQQLRDLLIKNKDKLGNCIIVHNIELSDGVHFSAEGHKLMANIIGEKLNCPEFYSGHA